MNYLFTFLIFITALGTQAIHAADNNEYRLRVYSAVQRAPNYMGPETFVSALEDNVIAKAKADCQYPIYHQIGDFNVTITEEDSQNFHIILVSGHFDCHHSYQEFAPEGFESTTKARLPPGYEVPSRSRDPRTCR